MQVDYSKLWAHYKELGHKNKTDLIEMAGISTNILAKLTKGEFISMESIQRSVIFFDRFYQFLFFKSLPERRLQLQ